MRYVAVVFAGMLLAAALHLAWMPAGDRARILRLARTPSPAPHAPPTRVPDAPVSPDAPAPAQRAAMVGTAGAPGAPTPAREPPAPGLLIPVLGVDASQLHPTFDQARGTDRRHEALDIMAPAGTPVLAVADGHVEKLFESERGGLTLYQFEPTGRHAYYYAHLDRYAPGIEEGLELRRGQVIGEVGSSGNADPAAPHLHFAVFVLGPEKHWWEGEPIDPWPLLVRDTP